MYKFNEQTFTMNAFEIIVPSVILSADRSVLYKHPVKLPEWSVSWKFLELQSVYRPKIDLGRIGSFAGIFDNEETVSGWRFIDHLSEGNLINQCLNLSDGVSIAAYEYCHSVFKGRKVLLWQSTVCDNQLNLFVPTIQSIRDQIPIIYWLWLGYDFNPNRFLGLLF